MTESSKIEIWTSESDDDRRAALPTLGKARIEVTHVEASVLSQNLKEFLAQFRSIFEDQEMSSSGYSIDEIELSLGVNAKGGVALLGKIEAGATASIKVKLKRERSSGQGLD